MKQTGHAWFPTNGQGTFHSSGSPTPQCASQLLPPLEKFLHRTLKEQGSLFPGWQQVEPSPAL